VQAGSNPEAHKGRQAEQRGRGWQRSVVEAGTRRKGGAEAGIYGH
jgi:hypothetical protein